MPETKKPNDPGSTPEGEGNDELELGAEAEGEAQGDAPSGEESFVDVLPEIPPELKPFAQKLEKQFKSAFTKKTQVLSEERKGMAEYVQKAMVLDKLLADPRIQNFLTGLEGNGNSDDLGDDDSEPTLQGVRKVVRPLQEKIQNLEEQSVNFRIMQEREAFVRSNPDWERIVGKDGLAESWRRNQHATIEEAYLAAVGRKVIARRNAKAKESPPEVERPGIPRKGATAPKKVESFDDALKQALDELGMKRIP